ncbi:MAG: hypothetical protein ACTS6H_00900 [Candidatus Hodgkinia cicadicola]
MLTESSKEPPKANLRWLSSTIRFIESYQSSSRLPFRCALRLSKLSNEFLEAQLSSYSSTSEATANINHFAFELRKLVWVFPAGTEPKASFPNHYLHPLQRPNLHLSGALRFDD